MIYLGLSAAKQIRRELTAGENKRCCIECNTGHSEAAGEIAANGKNEARSTYHIHMIRCQRAIGKRAWITRASV